LEFLQNPDISAVIVGGSWLMPALASATPPPTPSVDSRNDRSGFGPEQACSIQDMTIQARQAGCRPTGNRASSAFRGAAA
jgi:hypothetical protein